MTVFLPICGPAFASIIPDSQITFSDSTILGAQYAIRVTQTIAGDYTFADFGYAGTALTGLSVSLDEGSDWYLVNAGDIFSATTIATNQFPLIFKVLDQPPFFVSNTISIPLGTLYLGINTGAVYPGNSDTRNVFGWIQLYNDGNTLTPIANAVAYNEPGIIIGSTTPIPEPASLLLLAPALLLLRRRK